MCLSACLVPLAGFNRTGFVVCSYLIEHCGLTVDEALQSFAASRPPGVKHEKFRQELRARYGSSSAVSGSSSSAATVPVPVPAANVLTAGAGLAPGLAASPAGPLSCRSCGSSSSTAATGWPAGGSPEVVSADGRLAGSSVGPPLQLQPAGAAGSPGVSPAAAAGAAAVAAAPAGAGCPPRCCCCNAELSPEDAAAAAALATGGLSGHAAAAAGSGQMPQRSIPLGFSSSSSAGLDDTSCSTSSCFAAASSSTAGAACPTPPPYPLPPALPHSSSRGALLGSSPASRVPHRCWSSNSVGDNSSIGCSPTSSTADLITLRTSGLNSARSSGLDSCSGGGAPDDTPGSRGAGAADGRGSGMLLSEQWLGSAAAGGPNISRRLVGDSGGSGEYSGVGRLFGGRSSAGGCSSSGADGACGDDEYDSAEGSGAEEGCFEMDPYMDPPAAQQELEPEQQQRQGSFSSRGESGRGRQKSVTFQDQEAGCCEQAAPGCSAVTQQLRGADLDSLLASVSIHHQQAMQQQPQQLQLPLSPPLPQPVMQPRQGTLGTAAAECSCDCHNQQSPSAARGNKQGAGYSIRDGEAYDASVGSSSSRRQLDGEPPGGEVCLQRGYYSSEDGVFDPLENESFGKVTSADLLKNLR